MSDKIGPLIEDEPAAAGEPDEEQPALVEEAALHLHPELDPLQVAARAAPVTADLQNTSPEELAELSRNPQMLEASRAEVYRRLKDSPRKANFLTFRFLLSADEADKEDAFDGLMAVCWNQVKMRHALDPRRFRQETRRDAWDATRESIETELVDRLYALRDLSPLEVIQKALRGDFDRISVDVANAVRRQVRAAQKNIPLPSELEEGIQFERPLTWARSPLNDFEEVVELIEFHKPEIVDVVGETGYEVLLVFTEMAHDNVMPQGKREQGRALTEAIAARLGSKERQAREHKRRFREAAQKAVREGNPIFKEIFTFLDQGEFREPRVSGNGLVEKEEKTMARQFHEPAGDGNG